MKVYSADQGRTWSAPVALSPPLRSGGAFAGSARPMLLSILGGGPLLLSGGRPYLQLWVSADGTGDVWSAVNLAGEHNRRQADPALRFCDAFANGTSAWLESTCDQREPNPQSIRTARLSLPTRR
jgi:hypothetical protein